MHRGAGDLFFPLLCASALKVHWQAGAPALEQEPKLLLGACSHNHIDRVRCPQELNNISSSQSDTPRRTKEVLQHTRTDTPNENRLRRFFGAAQDDEVDFDGPLPPVHTHVSPPTLVSLVSYS
jgi:hypothetical protein